MRTLAQAAEFGRIAREYLHLRREHPTVRALVVKRYIHDDEGLTLEQFECAAERGHSWSYTGVAYGGDDESFGGEGRAYCCYCRADGDA